MAPLQLEIQLTATESLRQPVTPDQRGITFSNRKEWGIGGDRQEIFIFSENASFQR